MIRLSPHPAYLGGEPSALRHRVWAGIAALAGAFGLVLAVGVPGSAAGEFSFAQCGGLGGAFDGQYSRLGRADRVDVVSGCRPGGQGKVGVYQDRKGGQFQEAEGGVFAWRAPAGISVTGLTVRARLRDANGLRASISGRSSGDDLDLDGVGVRDAARAAALLFSSRLHR